MGDALVGQADVYISLERFEDAHRLLHRAKALGEQLGAPQDCLACVWYMLASSPDGGIESARNAVTILQKKYHGTCHVDMWDALHMLQVALQERPTLVGEASMSSEVVAAYVEEQFQGLLGGDVFRHINGPLTRK